MRIWNCIPSGAIKHIAVLTFCSSLCILYLSQILDYPRVQYSQLMASEQDSENMTSSIVGTAGIDHKRSRYPYCIVWTPIPMLTWMFPFIGHMGIGTSTGIIRDFAGPYYVSEDCMAFGKPTKYWQLYPEKVGTNNNFGANSTPSNVWDMAVADASEEYKNRMHNLCCDNCHSHVAMALNLMKYNNGSSWNMVKLAFLMLVRGKYVSFLAFLKTWLPFLIMLAIILTLVFVFH